MNIGRVYMIISPSGKVYVGSTTLTFKSRWRHYYKTTCKNQRKLYNSLKKYGPENHIFRELWEGNIELMYKKEIEFGKFYNVLDKNKGLNLQLPKESDIYKSFSLETLEKMSNSHKGKKHSEETINKMGKSPVYQTTEYKTKISKLHKGKIVSQETKDKISKKSKINCVDIIKKMAKLKMKSVLQYDLNNNFIKEWESMSKVMGELKIDKSQISACCKNKPRNKTAGGFIWRYK